jgi:hypothetical protein
LRRELHGQRPEVDKTFEIKKLLEVIDKMTEENTVLKSRLREFELLEPKGRDFSEKEKKDIYNEIHNRIDILNISIDKKQPEGGGEAEPAVRDPKKSRNSKNRFYR